MRLGVADQKRGDDTKALDKFVRAGCLDSTYAEAQNKQATM
jgi:hypothetical protein